MKVVLMILMCVSGWYCVIFGVNDANGPSCKWPILIKCENISKYYQMIPLFYDDDPNDDVSSKADY